MNLCKILILSILIFIMFSNFFTNVSTAALPIPLQNVAISAKINFDNKSGIYTYSYEVFNPEINLSQIRHFGIDITSKPGDANLDREGLVNGPCYDKYSSNYNIQQTSMIPVGIDGPYERISKLSKVTIWGCGLDLSGAASWGSNAARFRIFPSSKLNSFILKSFGIPGIRDADIKPGIDYDKLPPEYYENDELTKKLQDSLIYRTKTIGPTAPPKDLDPIAFLDGIIGMKHEAASLGWIKNKGVEISLDAKLENARKKIEQGNVKAAKNILGAFINEVEAQGCESYADCPGGKHLKPEAYALLKYNARYLIDNLK